MAQRLTGIKLIMIKVLLISIDQNLKSFMEEKYSLPEFQFITFNSSKDPLDLMSQIEAGLDFSDQDIQLNAQEELISKTKDIETNIHYRTGEPLTWKTCIISLKT